ncbi:rRNA pseudouridine synthase [Candidatus Saccharibacteria bacterium]|nr:rRNA pseudouridine synthase [Candidatus Saccharibacteria bacterium]
MRPGLELRLNKFLAERLGISRRQADDLIASGKVLVNGKTAALGARIDKNTKVCYNGKIVPFTVSYTYLALNKPAGYVCSRKNQGGTPTIYEILPEKYHELKTVGRLDKDSSGLILLTNDGDFAFSHTHPKFVKEKRYEVTLDRNLEPLHQQMIADFGVDLPDGKSRLGLSRLGDENGRKDWLVVMSEGRNRQIRRTFAALGYKVVRLHRIQFGKYVLNGLKPGEFTELKRN